MNEWAWHWLPEQQNLVIGDPEAPPGPGDPGGGGRDAGDPPGPGETPGPGAGEPDGTDAGGGVPGGRGVNPGRGYSGDAPQPGGRGQDEGWDSPGGSYDPEDAKDRARKHGYVDKPELTVANIGLMGLGKLALDSIRAQVASYKAAADLAEELGISEQQAREALGLGQDMGGDQEGRDGGEPPEPDDGDGKKEPPKPPGWGDPEYQEALRESLERLLGAQVAPGFELPNWSALLSYERPVHQVRGHASPGMQRVGQAMIHASVYRRIVAGVRAASPQEREGRVG